jgi:hypothetical protein
MRRLGLVLTVVGAVAFAALLALGLALGSGSVSAQDNGDEATPTPEATEAPEFCTPVIPGTYNGSVTIDGSPAADGVTITASIDGTVWGTTTTSGGRYVVDIPQSPPTVEPCFPGAGTLTFACDATAAADRDTWSSGLNDLDLTCAAAAPPATETPAATETPEVTPTATPEAPPPTGMGGDSSGGGFIWWPLALAAAAMTSVAGLFTARWARR